MPTEEFIREIFFVPVSSHFFDKTRSRESLLDGEVPVLGIQLSDASCAVTYPCIKQVWHNSPLVGRFFEGDFILKLNGTDMTGLTTSEVVEHLLATGKQDDEESSRDDKEEGGEGRLMYQMIKLTVMSAHADDGSAFDDNDTYDEEDDDIDFGLAHTGVEL